MQIKIKMPGRLVILLLLCPLVIFAQGKQKLKTIVKVYSAALSDSYFATEPKYIILIDSTFNKAITYTDYQTYMEQFSNPARKGYPAKLLIDSSWLGFLEEVDIKRKLLTSFVLPKINSIHGIRVIKKDSMRLAFKINANTWTDYRNIFGSAYGYVQISDVILSKNKKKAIVEINLLHDSKSGGGTIFLLERRKRKWIVVNSMQTWIA